MPVKCCIPVFILFFLVLTINVSGQVNGYVLTPAELGIDKSRLIERQKQLENEKTETGQSATAYLSQGSVFGKPELVGSNAQFNIYKLPLDNMLCLVPNENYFRSMQPVMERYKNSNQHFQGRIPNKFSPGEIINPGF